MKTIKTFLTTISISLFLAACSSTGEKPDKKNNKNRQQTLSTIKKSLEPPYSNYKQEPVPTEITNALMPSYKSYKKVPKQNIERERFDVSIKGAHAKNFFMGLVKDTAINMIVHPNVKGKISLSLKNVSIDEILEITREIYGYEFKKQNNGYLVLPAKMQSKIFQVNYLNVSREGSSHVNVNSGQLSTSDDASRALNNSNNTRTSTTNSNRNSVGSSSQINTTSKADFWAGLKKSVISIIGETDGRSVVVSPQSGIIVVRAMPDELRDVQHFLDTAQKSLHRQVVLEAKIIEVTLNEASKTGIDWTAISASGGDTAFIGNFNVTNGSASALTTDGLTGDTIAAVGNPSTYGTGGLFAIGAQTSDFVAMFKILDTQGDTQVLSSPRIATLNNQKAVIKVGSDEFFVTDIQSPTITGTTGTATSTPTVSLTPFFSGIALDVTPQITNDNKVTLHIHPQVSEVKDQIKTFTIFGSQQSLPLALSSVRESDSIIKANSGQIIVIGGLMQEKSQAQDSGNFGLSDIPLIGGIFKQASKSKIQSELVILLKPIIIENDNQWDEDVDNINRRVDQFY